MEIERVFRNLFVRSIATRFSKKGRLLKMEIERATKLSGVLNRKGSVRKGGS